MKNKQEYKSSHLYKMRHSAEHVFNQAIEELYPGKIVRAMGPAIDDGFYNDSHWDVEVSERDFQKIEQKMKEIIKKDLPFIKKVVTEQVAREMFEGNHFKQEFIDEFIKDGKELSVYYTGDPEKGEDVFVDLCSGPHVSSTKEIKAVKLLSIAGAYWRGDEKNEMLTRIYGTAFESKDDLKEYLAKLELAKERDHKKIGKEQSLYFIDELVGKGLIMWLPRGNVIKDQVEAYAKQMEEDAGYMRVTTPVIAKKELFETSGHLPYYKEDMFPSMKDGDDEFYLKAMNCPHHHRIFDHDQKSYKDLPIRLAEYGRCHRYEQSGELSGLLRVRGMEMNDAHIYLRKDQIKEEMKNVLGLIQNYFKVFGFKNYWFRMSKWDPKRTDKYIDQPENWEYSEQMIREVLDESGVEYFEAEDEAAFYGPKIDVQFESVFGREESMSTVQLDFIAKVRFGLSYIDEEGKENNDIFVIHRAPLSVHERFLAFVIEHFGGAFPVWMHPEQVAIVPISEKNTEYAEKVRQQLKEAMPSLRIKTYDADDRMQKRIRKAQVDKIPYILVLGGKEEEDNVVNVRLRTEEQVGSMSIAEFVERAKGKIDSKALDL